MGGCGANLPVFSFAVVPGEQIGKRSTKLEKHKQGIGVDHCAEGGPDDGVPAARTSLFRDVQFKESGQSQLSRV